MGLSFGVGDYIEAGVLVGVIVLNVTIAPGPLLCSLKSFILTAKNRKGRCPLWVTACGASNWKFAEPLSALNGNNARNICGRDEKRLGPVECAMQNRKQGG